VSDSFSKNSPERKNSPELTIDDDSLKKGQLSIVATPIGNLGDITYRAIEVLNSADIILAEDTRHSKGLLNHFAIGTELRSCHEHNEAANLEWVKRKLDAGANLALISDAGTPLISDPGFILVRALRQGGYSVVAVPGASSIIAALSIAGLPTDSFVYDGFLPAKRSARHQALARYANEPRTAVVLESSHRIKACLADVVTVLGADRQLVLARELTKRFETVLSGSAQTVLEILQNDDNQSRGEFVLMLAGVEPVAESEADVAKTLNVLLGQLSVKQAANIAAKLLNKRKNDVYEHALRIKKDLDTNA